jgi:hypothetical protein
MNKETINTIIATVCTAAGGITTGMGYTDGNDVAAINGGLVGVVGLVWAGINIYNRVKAKNQNK